MLLCIKHAHGQDSNSMQSGTWFDSCCRPKCNGGQATSISLQNRGKKKNKKRGWAQAQQIAGQPRLTPRACWSQMLSNILVASWFWNSEAHWAACGVASLACTTP